MLVRDAKLLMETQERRKVQKFGRASDISGSSLFKKEYFASDLDQSTRKLLDRGRRLTEILKQPQYQPLTVEEQVVVIYAGVNGFLDSIDIKEVTNFEKDLLKSLNSNGKNILEIIIAI